MMIDRVCANCGKVFQVRESVLKQGRGKVCSKACSYAMMRRYEGEGELRQCPRCGKEYRVCPSQIAHNLGKHCSRECSRPPQVRLCLTCGNEFRFSPSDDQKYCSVECCNKSPEKSEVSRRLAHAAWDNDESRQRLLEGIKRRSQDPTWRSAAHFQQGTAHPKFRGNKRGRDIDAARYEYKAWHKAVLRRDDYTCQICGERGGRLQAHHIKEWAEYPESRYDVDNGMTLCKGCHRRLHARIRELLGTTGGVA